VGGATKKGAKKIMGLVTGVPKEESPKRKEARIAHQQKIGRKALDLFNLDPSKSISEYYRSLQESDPFK
jgi:hypothetical protein